MKKVLLVIGGIVAILLIATAVIPVMYKDKLRVVLEKELNKSLNANVVFSEVQVSMFRHFPNLTLTLDNLLVTGKGEFRGDTLLSTKELDLELALFKLFAGKTELKSMYFLEPDVHILVHKNGDANYNIAIADTTKPADTTSSVSLNMDKVILENADIIYHDESIGSYIEMLGVYHEGSGNFTNAIFDWTTKTDVRAFTMDYDNVRYLDQKESSLDMVMEVNTNTFKFTFKENNVRINHFHFGIEGWFTMLPNGYDMDMKFAAKKTMFSNILSLMPGIYMEDMKKMKTDGDIAFDGWMKGFYSDSTLPAYHLNLKVNNAMFKFDSLPMPVENIMFDLVADNKDGKPESTILDFKTFKMKMDKNVVDGKIRIEGLKNYNVAGEIKADIDLDDIDKMYPIKHVLVEGHLKADVVINGTYNDSLKQYPAYHADLRLQDGSFKIDTLPVPVEKIQFHLVADNKDGKAESTIFNFETFGMKMDKNTLSGNLLVQGLKTYKLKGELKADIDLDDLDKVYPTKNMTTKGDLKIDVTLDGTYDSTLKKFPNIDAKFNLTNGYLKSSDYPEPIKEIHLVAEVTNTTGTLAGSKLNIMKLTYTLEDEPFIISGSVVNFDDYNYDLKIKGAVDLGKMTKVYPVQGMNISGIIDTDIETKGRVSDVEAKRYGRIATSGSLEIKDLQVSGTSIARPVKISDALFTFTPAKIVLEHFTGKFGRGTVTMKGELSDYMAFITDDTKDMIKGDLDLKCDTLDINEWMPKQSATTATAPATPAKADTATTLTVIAIPKNIDFVFDSDINYCLYDDMQMTDMQGEIRIKDGVMTMNETGFNAIDAKFYLSGDYNTSDIKHPYIDFDLSIKELDIQKAYKDLSIIRTLAPAAANMHGIFSVDYTLKSDLDKHMQPITPSMLGGGTIRIHEAKIDGMKLFDEMHKVSKKDELHDPSINDFVLETEIKNNKIFVKPASLKVNGLNTEIQGSNDISGTMDYLIKVELLPIEKLKIPFHVTGSYDKPKVAMGKAKSDSTFVNQ